MLKILIIVIICLSISFLDKIRVKEEYGLDEMKADIKMGDLILFRSDDVTIMHEYLTPFTHVGLVLEKDGEKKILEIHNEGDVEHMGLDCKNVVIYNFEDRVLYYEGDIYCMKLKNKLSAEIKREFIKNIPELRKITFYKDYKKYTTENCLINNRSTKDNGSMFCSEFIGHCLKKLSLIEESYNISCLFPGDFRDLKRGGENLFNEVKKLNKLE